MVTEEQLARHLEAHHGDATTGYAMFQLPSEDITEVNVAAIDRYGVDLLCAAGDTFHHVRAGFDAPVTDEDSLTRELRRCFIAFSLPDARIWGPTPEVG